tara:strand:- start:49 stop:1092 length:1044 start_codon:yes stop_codon:yes gene_type:complete
MNKNLLRKLYQIFHLIKFSQEYLIKTYHPEDKMRCPMHFCLGQEAIASSSYFFLQKNDFVLSHHRSHGYYLAKKCSLNDMISEFYGKENGSNSGLAGSQELSYSKNNFYSGTILSGMFSMALGTSFAQNKSSKNNITMAIIGDGGMEEGIVYETLNLASLHKLPILFICENNNYSVHTHISVRTKTYNFKNKVKSFDVDYMRISDYKIDKIFKKVQEAFSKVRKKRKPLFLEFDTMRTCSHVGPESDDKEHNYRNKDLLLWRKRDTFKNLRFNASKANGLNKIKKIEKDNEKKVITAFSRARKQKPLNYEKSIKFNFTNTYSKIIKKFGKPKLDFKEGQKETKLNPY